MSDHVKREDVLSAAGAAPGECWCDLSREVYPLCSACRIRALPGVDVDAFLAERDRLWREYLACRVALVREYDARSSGHPGHRDNPGVIERNDAAEAKLLAHGAQVDG